MLVDYEYVQLSGDYAHENIYKDTMTILEYRIIVYDGVWKFDNGIILNKDFRYYSMQNNVTENLQRQNIQIKLLSPTGKATLIIKKALSDFRLSPGPSKETDIGTVTS